MTVAVVTGAGAGVGRATAREFARNGYDVGLIGRNTERLEAAAQEIRDMGMRACVASADIANAAAVEAAADAVETALGPIDVWVNNAMATVFAPLAKTDAAAFKRGTEVTYLGTVHGTQAALRRMRLRDHGAIINIGSALAYRSVPLQAVYCGAKAAIRGFTDAVRSELFHDKSCITMTMVHLPAINTPQFDWAMNKMGLRPQPVGPIYQPEVPARAIVFAAQHPRRDIWVGFSTVLSIMANRLAPGLADRYLAYAGYSGQLTDEREPADAPDNLYHTVDGAYAAHGRFDARARESRWDTITSRHRDTVVAVGAVLAFMTLRRIARRLRF